MTSGDITEDLDGVEMVAQDDDPDVVLLGGAGPEFGYEELNAVFGHVQRGAQLIAMHRNLHWRTDAGLQLDTGALLLGLERAADVEATVIGKPAGAFFSVALHMLGVAADVAVMVGDDVEADVLGAQAAGITGVLVRTGKFREQDGDGVDGGRPQHVLDSVADLAELLGLPHEYRPGRHEYRVTAAGADLWPALHALTGWGERHFSPGGRKRVFVHADCDAEIDASGVCSRCAARPGPAELEIRPGPALVDRRDDPVSVALRKPHRLLTPLPG